MTDCFARGGCICGKVRYRLKRAPIFVHCCHCKWCQRETGSAFVLNAMIETGEIEREGIAPETVLTPSESGSGQKVMRCPSCRVAIWSHYATLDMKLAFVRVGTLDDPSLCPPDVHIFTGSKQCWMIIPEGSEQFESYYNDGDRTRMFGSDAIARREALLES
jgi:hypothetical protein